MNNPGVSFKIIPNLSHFNFKRALSASIGSWFLFVLLFYLFTVLVPIIFNPNYRFTPYEQSKSKVSKQQVAIIYFKYNLKMIFLKVYVCFDIIKYKILDYYKKYMYYI